MKKIKVNDKVCFNCAHYTAYYRKGFHSFFNYGCGTCEESSSIVKDENSCGAFLEKKRESVTKKQIDDTITDLKKLLKFYT